MTDRTESPWVTLAERLGMDCDWSSRKTFRVTVPSTMGGIPLCEAESQDLLIGRALRVAWDAYVKNGGELDKTSVLNVFWESSRPEFRPITAIELLDAVGYTND